MMEDSIENEIEVPSDHKYYTMIPNIVFDIGLSIYSVRLYCTLKRIAGEEGKCWMNTEHLAELCKMSTGMVSQCKQVLSENGLISIQSKECPKGKYHEIKIIDIWARNIEYESTHSLSEQLSGSPHEPDGSPHERKKITVNKNTEIPQQKLQPSPSSPATESLAMTTTEEYKKRTEDALFASLQNTTSDYTHNYPEDVRPVVERMARLWNFRPPDRPRKKGGQYAFWIEACGEILEACGEFGVGLLDDLHADWRAYLEEHGGLAPYAIQTPRSLLGAVSGKARLLRSGSQQSQWADSRKPAQAAHQTTLDV